MSTTATVAATANLATDLTLDHPDAIRLADQLEALPPDQRRHRATAAAAARRADLALYAALYAERYGVRLDVRQVEANDVLYNDLLLLATA